MSRPSYDAVQLILRAIARNFAQVFRRHLRSILWNVSHRQDRVSDLYAGHCEFEERPFSPQAKAVEFLWLYGIRLHGLAASSCFAETVLSLSRVRASVSESDPDMVVVVHIYE